MADKREDDPLEGAQYGPKEPRSRLRRLADTVSDADYMAAMQSLGPNGYVMGGLTGLGGNAAKASKAVKDKPKYAKGGAVKSASRRGDGIAQRGKTVGKII
jgi:hypothetical protein